MLDLLGNGVNFMADAVYFLLLFVIHCIISGFKPMGLLRVGTIVFSL